MTPPGRRVTAHNDRRYRKCTKEIFPSEPTEISSKTNTVTVQNISVDCQLGNAITDPQVTGRRTDVLVLNDHRAAAAAAAATPANVNQR